MRGWKLPYPGSIPTRCGGRRGDLWEGGPLVWRGSTPGSCLFESISHRCSAAQRPSSPRPQISFPSPITHGRILTLRRIASPGDSASVLAWPPAHPAPVMELWPGHPYAPRGGCQSSHAEVQEHSGGRAQGALTPGAPGGDHPVSGWGYPGRTSVRVNVLYAGAGPTTCIAFNHSEARNMLGTLLRRG